MATKKNIEIRSSHFTFSNQPLIFCRNLASRFKELLQTVVNICVNFKDKYPELKEFLERIKIYAEDLKGMKREIIMPINNDDYLRDVVLENKLLGMYSCLISYLVQLMSLVAHRFKRVEF